ncbi:bifunctional adenosylcobinamide kinase/adenosylcobinamide-phosphate guanylyltransferase [Halomonas cupida]|uniref:bifunctional adenosylcobinamide kinase/adenosylcobinamide-phosphate guanylyltransferase n=1 Tax=Halomonas cupida TaxID=44933 RepID=UPI003EF11BF3
MHVFLGGAHSGKHQRVAEQYPGARWCKAHEWLSGSVDALGSAESLVVCDWLDWLTWALPGASDQELQGQWRDAFTRLRSGPGPRIVIVQEVGRGIVPVDPEQRRLRDLMGWLGQDACQQADSVTLVRHGLMMPLSGALP